MYRPDVVVDSMARRERKQMECVEINRKPKMEKSQSKNGNVTMGKI